MNQRMHKRTLYRRVRAGRITALLKVMGEIGDRVPRHIEFDEFHKIPAPVRLAA